MGSFQTVKTDTVKKKSKFILERNKTRQETEINYNGMLLGRNSYNNGRTYYIDDETREIIEVGIFENPFQAAESLLKIHNEREGLRQERREQKQREWMDKPLIKMMLNDYNNLPNDFFKPKEFKTFYKRNIFEYEALFPELAI